MPRLSNLPRLLFLAVCPLLVGACGLARGQQSTVPSRPLFSSIPASPMAETPLSAHPYVFRLKHLDPAEMSPQDASVVTELSPQLARKAALLSFNLDHPGWLYHQIDCPAFPDYIFLAYSQDADPSGGSRFVAALNRSGSPLLIVPSLSHGSQLDNAWGNPSSYVIFNRILLEERGRTSLATAPNWLVISMCYAEFTGNHVQALTARPLPDTTLDMVRLDAALPQLNLSPDHSAVVTFSDASQPRKTTLWTLNFDPEGQLTAVAQDKVRQPHRIALRP